MKWFKKMFFKKEKEDVPEIEEAVIPAGFKVRKCAACGGDILPGEKWTKQIGIWFHRSCWKKGKNEA